MTEPVIELRSVHKTFSRGEVLKGVNITVPAGKTYAFLGRNGAGKTTTIRLLMGLLTPDAGSVRLLGLDPAKDALAIRQQVGYLAEDQQMWGWMKIREILRFISAFYPTWDWRYATQLLEKFALPADAKIRHLSKGQNVRLGLLLALAHRPRLMILDDPALGLDPIMRKDFLRDVVEHLQGQNITVFFSSHLLYEVEPVADIIGILHAGRIAVESGTEDLRAQVRQITLPIRTWDAVAPRMPGVLDVRRHGDRIALIVADIAKARAVLTASVLSETELNLDEIFEAYVAGRKEVGHDSPVDLERVA